MADTAGQQEPNIEKVVGAEAQQQQYDQTLNDRAGFEEEHKEAGNEDFEQWMEVRLQGKLPERRSNHCSFIFQYKNNEFLYIHGGRDLKEGATSTMWRVNLHGVQRLHSDASYPVEWEPVTGASGRDTGKISHHTAAIVNSKEVVFYGGIKNTDSNPEIFVFNVINNSWSTVSLNQKVTPEPRDDHSMTEFGEGFVVFGGFVNGSRVDEALLFKPDERKVSSIFSTATADMIAGGDSGIRGPLERASQTIVNFDEKLFVFGGQDDDNNKLDDFWQFEPSSKAWTQLSSEDDQVRPIARSGHSAVVYGAKMYIFGGIHELTKELNDLAVFNFGSMKFSVHTGESEEAQKQEQNMLAIERQNHYANEAQSPARKSHHSPSRRMTVGIGKGPSSPTRSPMKKRVVSPHKKQRGEHHNEEPASKQERDGLSSPISNSMQNTFIIKNADESFDAYYHQMKKRKQAGNFGHGSDAQATNHLEAKFGLVHNVWPTARDGHSAKVDQAGFMYVFGGDRHHMPFNDLYMIKLK